MITKYTVEVRSRYWNIWLFIQRWVNLWVLAEEGQQKLKHTTSNTGLSVKIMKYRTSDNQHTILIISAVKIKMMEVELYNNFSWRICECFTRDQGKVLHWWIYEMWLEYLMGLLSHNQTEQTSWVTSQAGVVAWLSQQEHPTKSSLLNWWCC